MSLTGKRPDFGDREGINSSTKLIFKDVFICRLFDASTPGLLVSSKFYRKHVLSFSSMFTCRGLFFSAISLTVAVMNHQMEILQL